jgi:transcriptional regulator with XRE-family HTH domain
MRDPEEINQAMRDFGALLRECRTKKGLSVRKLGEKASIRFPAISTLENGGNTTLENIVRIVDGLGCRLTIKRKK